MNDPHHVPRGRPDPVRRRRVMLLGALAIILGLVLLGWSVSQGPAACRAWIGDRQGEPPAQQSPKPR